jgi:apolipoprotein D and lipocalin family protein
VTAEYALRPDGDINVLNTCHKGEPSGPVSVAKGRAKRTGDRLGAKLKVSFFGPFYADYWVLDRAEDYSWSIVGEPSGRFLWILTRTAVPSLEVQSRLRERVREFGYDLSLVHFTQQK